MPFPACKGLTVQHEEFIWETGVFVVIEVAVTDGVLDNTGVLFSGAVVLQELFTAANMIKISRVCFHVFICIFHIPEILNQIIFITFKKQMFFDRSWF